MLTGNSKRWK